MEMPKDINLKVMRISKPVLHERAPIFSEEDADDFSDENASGLSSAYLMPNSVGDFYLGEPAHFLLSIQNMSEPAVQLTDVKVTVQTESRNAPRTINGDVSIGELAPNEIRTTQVKIDCRYPEEMNMLCAVEYANRGQGGNYRRKYLLPVRKPFDISWQWTALAKGSAMLNVIIMNKVIERTVIFQTCSLNNSPGERKCAIKALSAGEAKPIEADGVFSRGFMVESADGNDFSTELLSLDLKWLPSNGQVGHIQYSQIKPKVDKKNKLELSIHKHDDQHFPPKCNEAFSFSVFLCNQTERVMEVEVLLESDERDSIKWNCVSKVDLGKLAPSAQKTVSLSAIPLLKGFHSLPSIIVNERLLNQTYAFRDFYKVPVS